MIDKMRLYYASPYPLRVLAASARGYSLRGWRYGPDTPAQVEAALEKDTWPRERLEAWQAEQTSEMLEHAAKNVPYYRELWQARRRSGDQASTAYLENWPVLRKEPLRTNSLAFLADGCDPRKMSGEHTSGTSGQPLNLYRSRATTRAWYALNEARLRGWNGITRQDRWAILGGNLVAEFGRAKPPFWVWNQGLNQLYMSSYHVSPKNAPAYLEALERHRIVYLLGYPSAIYALAQLAEEKGLSAPRMRVVISNAEQLHPFQRSLIGKVFGCRVVDTYGMVEVAAAASECAEGHLHLWPETGILEVFEDGEDVPAPTGTTGRFILTGLMTKEMPLIRYEVGDRGALATPDWVCECGRQLPVIQQIEGRLDDVIQTPDGRRVGRLSPVFKGDLPIRQAQVVQEDFDSLLVQVVPAPGYTGEAADVIIGRMRERVGDMRIDVIQVEAIPYSSNGKARLIVSRLSAPRPN